MLFARSRIHPEIRPSMNGAMAAGRTMRTWSCSSTATRPIGSGEQNGSDQQRPTKLGSAEAPASAKSAVQQGLVQPAEDRLFSKTWHHKQVSPPFTSQSDARAQDEENSGNPYSDEEGDNSRLPPARRQARSNTDGSKGERRSQRHEEQWPSRC